jgi:glutamine synthetase adenylyltransferase
MREGVISTEDAGVLIKTYKYYRMLETFLRLNEADMITEGSELALMCSKFMGHKSPQEFIENLHKLRQRVLAISRY